LELNAKNTPPVPEPKKESLLLPANCENYTPQNYASRTNSFEVLAAQTETHEITVSAHRARVFITGQHKPQKILQETKMDAFIVYNKSIP